MLYVIFRKRPFRQWYLGYKSYVALLLIKYAIAMQTFRMRQSTEMKCLITVLLFTSLLIRIYLSSIICYTDKLALSSRFSILCNSWCTFNVTIFAVVGCDTSKNCTKFGCNKDNTLCCCNVSFCNTYVYFKPCKL